MKSYEEELISSTKSAIKLYEMFRENMAKLNWEYMNALMKVGFTRKEAVAIISSNNKIL